MTQSDMDPIIVSAEKRHLPEIETIERACFSVPWTMEMLQNQLDNGSHIFLAAEDCSGRVVGYMGLQFVLDDGYISNVAVAPARRRCGIGRALIAAMEDRARKKCLSFLTLEVRQSNAAAIALYERAGFARVGHRRGYYEKPREDAILMTMFLSGGGVAK
jgi:ribosomal-protein-alanine N-acetyltransferase